MSSPAPTALKRWRCGCSTSTGRARRSRTPTPGCWRSLPRPSHDQRPLVFEDGEQRRDFVHVEDIARAFRAAMERPGAADGTLNVASGRSVSIAEVARAMAEARGRPDLAPRMVGRARSGDVRHCFADIARAREALGFEPRRGFEDSLGDLAEWVASQACEDRVDHAASELSERGLVA